MQFAHNTCQGREQRHVLKLAKVNQLMCEK
jgi:hypothetical protein